MIPHNRNEMAIKYLNDNYANLEPIKYNRNHTVFSGDTEPVDKNYILKYKKEESLVFQYEPQGKILSIIDTSVWRFMSGIFGLHTMELQYLIGVWAQDSYGL